MKSESTIKSKSCHQNEINKYKKAILVSGDGDFYSLIEYLDKKNKLGKILTPNWKYSKLFKNYDKYIYRLDEQRKLLEYRKRKRL